MKAQLLRYTLPLLVLIACAQRQDPLEELLAVAFKNADGGAISHQASEFLLTNQVEGILMRDQYPPFVWLMSKAVGRAPTSVGLQQKDMLQIEFGGGGGGIGVRFYSDAANPQVTLSGRTRMIHWTNNVYFYTSP